MSQCVAVSHPPVFLSGVGFTPVCLRSSYLPSHWKQMAACEACQCCGSNVFYPQIKYVGGGISDSTTRQSSRRPFPHLCLGLSEISNKRAGMGPALSFRAGRGFLFSFFLLQHNGSVFVIKLK